MNRTPEQMAVLVLGIFLLCACDPCPTSPPKAISDIDGCTMYEVNAGCRLVYTTICKKSRASTEWTTTRLVGRVPTTEKHRVETMGEE